MIKNFANKVIARIYLFMAFRSHDKADIAGELYYLQMSAKLGNAVAQNNLGCVYLDGKIITEDVQQALYWFRVSAEQGEMNAQANLGSLYADGFGVQPDLKLSNYWFSKAAEQGHEDSIIILAEQKNNQDSQRT